MAMAALIVKVMPEGVETDLVLLEETCKRLLEEKGGLNVTFETKPIAFGLKALFVKFAWPEKQDTGMVEEILSSIPEVSSVTIEDYRRAFG